MTKTYAELMTLKTYEERVEYLRLYDFVGNNKFGYSRDYNQAFYKSPEWRDIRRKVITRDAGCDLGCRDRPLKDVIVHHMNPPTLEDYLNHSDSLLDEDNLVCVSDATHRLIHYGVENVKIQNGFVERKPGDTCPWRVT